MENARGRILLFATLREKCGVTELEVKCDGTVLNLVENAAKTIDEGL